MLTPECNGNVIGTVTAGESSLNEGATALSMAHPLLAEAETIYREGAKL